MKKTLTANLNGKVFNIDEDAFSLLDNYLKNLRIFFSKEEGKEEILNDIEARIEELFSEKNGIITISDVEGVIQKMGNTSDFGLGEKTENEIPKNNFQTQPSDIKAEKKLYRNINDKMIGGVCSGIAAFFGMDANLWRVIAIILFFASVSTIVPIYIIMWIFVPAARTAEEKLKMRGIPVTVENIGKTFSAENPKQEGSGCLSFIVTAFMICLVGLGLLIIVPVAFALLLALVVIVAVLFGVGTESVMQSASILFFSHSSLSIVAITALSLLFVIPGIYLIYNFIAQKNRLKPVHKSVKIIGIIIWILALLTLLFAGLKFNRENISINFGNHSTTVRGDGNIINRNLKITDAINELSVSNALHIDIEAYTANDTLPYAILKTDSNIIENMDIVISQGRLKIGSKRDNYLDPSGSIVLYLPVKNLRDISLWGASYLKTSEKFSAEKLNLGVEGASNLQLDDIDVQYINVDLQGVSKISLSGCANFAEYEINGASTADCNNLESDSIKLKINGVSTIHCSPASYLKGSVNGVSKVYYKGNPTVNVSSSGVSSVTRED